MVICTLRDPIFETLILRPFCASNKLLASKKLPVIKKVRFFVQLNDPRDTGLTAEWDSTQSVFVDPVTKSEILAV